MEAIFDDVLELLRERPSTWIHFTETVFLPFEKKEAVAYGFYNYLADVYVFNTEVYGPRVLVITVTSPKSAQWFYSRSDELLDAFLKISRTVRSMMSEASKKDRDLDPA